jgi:hypothetical protein
MRIRAEQISTDIKSAITGMSFYKHDDRQIGYAVMRVLPRELRVERQVEASPSVVRFSIGRKIS